MPVAICVMQSRNDENRIIPPTFNTLVQSHHILKLLDYPQVASNCLICCPGTTSDPDRLKIMKATMLKILRQWQSS